MQNRHWNLYTRVWKILVQYDQQPHRIMLLLGALVIAASGLGVLVPYLMKQIVDLSPLRQFEIDLQTIWRFENLSNGA